MPQTKNRKNYGKICVAMQRILKIKTYFWLNPEFFQKIILHNAYVSKHIDHEGMSTFKDHT